MDQVILVLENPDPEEIRKRRVRQIAYLGRYGKQCMLQWDDVDLAEFEELHHAVSEIVREENDSKSADTNDIPPSP